LLIGGHRRRVVTVRRVVLIVLALALVPAMATATSYRCMYDGQTRTACCCPTKQDPSKTPAEAPALRSACCCTITQATMAARAIGTMPMSDLPALGIPPVVTIEPVFTPVPVAVAAIVRPKAQAGPPCSLLARHCSLLL